MSISVTLKQFEIKSSWIILTEDEITQKSQACKAQSLWGHPGSALIICSTCVSKLDSLGVLRISQLLGASMTDLVLALEFWAGFFFPLILEFFKENPHMCGKDFTVMKLFKCWGCLQRRRNLKRHWTRKPSASSQCPPWTFFLGSSASSLLANGTAFLLCSLRVEMALERTPKLLLLTSTLRTRVRCSLSGSWS